MVEQVLDGITFTATTGGFSLIQVDADKKVINEVKQNCSELRHDRWRPLVLKLQDLAQFWYKR